MMIVIYLCPSYILEKKIKIKIYSSTYTGTVCVTIIHVYPVWWPWFDKILAQIGEVFQVNISLNSVVLVNYN